MHENHLDAQRTQDGQVEQNVGKIVRSGNLPVEGNNEHTLPETGNVLEDFTQVGDVHFDDGNCRDSNSSGTLKTKVAVELSSNDRCQQGRRLQRRKNPAIRHRHDPGAFEFLQDLFSSRTRKARGTVWPEDAHGMRHPVQARFNVESEPPSEKSEDGVLGARLLSTRRQRAHHFLIHP